MFPGRPENSGLPNASLMTSGVFRTTTGLVPMKMENTSPYLSFSLLKDLKIVKMKRNTK